jgi:hypothetical protein
MYLYLLEQASDDISYYLMSFFLLILLTYCFRKDIGNPIDPIVFCFISFSFITSLVIWLFFNGHIQIDYIIEYLICSAMFITGFRLYGKPAKDKENRPSYKRTADDAINYNSVSDIIDLKQLKIICILTVVVMTITLTLAFFSNALAIFSDSPVLDRVAISTANRWFTVAFFGYNNVGITLSIMIFALSKKIPGKVFYLCAILVFLISLASGGSKSAILPAVVSLGCIKTYFSHLKCQTPKIINRLIVVFGLMTAIYFVYITSLPGTGDEKNAFTKLLTRIASSGDNYIYFFVEDQYKRLEFTYDMFSYVAHTFTAPFGIKLIPYNIGTALYGSSTGDYSGFGPNPGYVIEGMIFFGLYAAPIYALAIGYLTNYTRNMFTKKKGNLNLILFIILSQNAPSLPIDINLYIFSVFSSILVNMPIYYLSRIFNGQDKGLKKSQT